MTDESEATENGEAEEDAEAEGESEGEVKKSLVGKLLSKKLLLIGGIVVVLLGGAGAGAYFTGLIGGGGEPGPDAAAPPPVAHYLDLDEMVVTLGAGGKSGFLKMQVSLELENSADEARVKAVMPRIVDNFQVFLRELRIEELQGSHGLYRVKEELLARVNAAAHPTKVKDVLFKEMLVQ